MHFDDFLQDKKIPPAGQAGGIKTSMLLFQSKFKLPEE
jgi:hypothetical protein